MKKKRADKMEDKVEPCPILTLTLNKGEEKLFQRY